MFGGPKIKLDKDLMERLTKVASASGYSSVDEFVKHVLEKELAAIDDDGSEEEIKKKLEGLGYMS
jgi:metal-responsive CopG/Arc/MetJ family transcriptional regulator